MRSLLAIVLVFLAAATRAAEVDLSAARQFARGWRGRAVKDGRTVRDAAGRSRFHVVTFAGGGWAAVGADDGETPVIAFSDNGEDLVADDANPVWFLVTRDAERRERTKGGAKARHRGWEKRRGKTAGGMKLATATATLKTSVSALDDVRVAPLVQSTWNQSTANNYANGPLCYNYYTPSNYVCGCVATMTAQMMRYFAWPKAPVTPKTFPCYVGESIPAQLPPADITNCTMIAGAYDWTKMTLKPASSTPEENRREIGKLCYDVGVSVNMMWSAAGSGAMTFMVREALLDTWGYSDAHAVVYDDGIHPYDSDEFRTIVVSNCEAGLPVGYGISGARGGHAVVIDGYGYSGDDFYIHINPGWGGQSNAWYCPPNLSMGSYSFDSSDELVYNVFTEGSGALVTGRVVDQHGDPVAGAGIEAFRLDNVNVGTWKKPKYVTQTNRIATAVSAADGRYHFKTGTNVALALYATAKFGASTDARTDAVPRVASMKGSRTSPFSGMYSFNNYSLGNRTGVDFRLFVPRPFSVHVQ